MTITYIYGLWDCDYNLRYIGKADNPKCRLYAHMSEARRGHKSHKNNWIRSLISQGLEPQLEILEECTKDNWEEKERNWIKEARQKGLNLVNTTIGGDGVCGYEFTDEHRQKLSQAQLKREGPGPNKGITLSEEWKRNVSIGVKKVPKTPEWNLKNSLAVTMMWAKRKNNIERIYDTQDEYYRLFGHYNEKYPYREKVK